MTKVALACSSKRALTPIVSILLAAMFANPLSTLAQAPGAWSTAAPRALASPTGGSPAPEVSIQTHTDTRGRVMDKPNVRRGLYHVPQGDTEIWPDCELAIDRMRDVLRMPVGTPAVVIVSENGPRGYYSDGVITLRKDADCSVLVHELVHHSQFLRLGVATSADEWHRREFEAKHIEQQFRNAQ